jgi:hypothetical protein
MEVTDQLHAPAALFPGNELSVLTRYGAGWAPEPVCGEKKNPFSLLEI